MKAHLGKRPQDGRPGSAAAKRKNRPAGCFHRRMVFRDQFRGQSRQTYRNRDIGEACGFRGGLEVVTNRLPHLLAIRAIIDDRLEPEIRDFTHFLRENLTFCGIVFVDLLKVHRVRPFCFH